MTLKDQSLCKADKPSTLVAHVESGGRHGRSQLYDVPLDVAHMLSLVQHVGNRRCSGPDQLILGFSQGLVHGQFIQVRDYICRCAFVPLAWYIPCRVTSTAHSKVFGTSCSCHADESLHQQ